MYLEDSNTRYALLKSEVGAEIRRNKSQVLSSNSKETAGIEGSIQQDVENAINSWLVNKSDLWGSSSRNERYSDIRII